MNTLTESTVHAFVAAKLKGMRVLSVGSTQTPTGQDIIIRLARTEEHERQHGGGYLDQYGEWHGDGCQVGCNCWDCVQLTLGTKVSRKNAHETAQNARSAE